MNTKHKKLTFTTCSVFITSADSSLKGEAPLRLSGVDGVEGVDRASGSVAQIISTSASVKPGAKRGGGGRGGGWLVLETFA